MIFAEKQGLGAVMDRSDKIEEVNLMEHLAVLWKRKWLIVVAAAVLAAGALIAGLLTPPIWEIDCIVLPSKFLVQTDQGQFNEIISVDPRQVAGQINQDSYNGLLAADLNLDIRSFPKIRAENLRDTKLIRISLREHDVARGRKILAALFNHLKVDFDKKIDVEIANNLDEIKILEIQKDMTKQEVLTAQNKMKISEDRSRRIREEFDAVKARVDRIDGELKKALGEKREGTDAVALLLYSNDAQNNLRYANTLEDKLRDERITRENEGLAIKNREETLKQIDTKIDLLKEKRQRIDYAQLVKEPTSSLDPVSPRKTRNAVLAAALGAALGVILAFFLEALKKAKAE
jgi:capsular polysaccharide biosynthesis protein